MITTRHLAHGCTQAEATHHQGFDLGQYTVAKQRREKIRLCAGDL
jgi:hypothetical protein